MRSDGNSTANDAWGAPVPPEVIAENLRRTYDGALKEDMPDRLHQLIEELRATGEDE